MKTTIKFPLFDAEMNTDVCDRWNNAELTLKLRLGFRQINPAGGALNGTHHDYGDANDPTRRTIRWTPAAWSVWTRNFVTSAQRFWSGKFWLVNAMGSFSFQHGAITYVPNIWCRAEITAHDATAVGNHHTIDVVRLDPREKWFGSHATLYDSLDTSWAHKRNDSTNKKVMQKAHVHEVGHLLGLGHVDIGKPHCPAAGDTNLGPCYGIADEDVHSVMGAGMQLRPQHAQPWREAIRHFALAEMASNPGAVAGLLVPVNMLLMLPQAMNAVWKPELRRHYPRTTAEVGANVAVTTRLPRAA